MQVNQEGLVQLKDQPDLVQPVEVMAWVICLRSSATTATKWRFARQPKC